VYEEAHGAREAREKRSWRPRVAREESLVPVALAGCRARASEEHQQALSRVGAPQAQSLGDRQGRWRRWRRWSVFLQGKTCAAVQ
jgi:hypothetical protein